MSGNPEDTEFQLKYTNEVIPLYMAWHYHIKRGTLTFIGHKFRFPQLTHISLHQLVKKVKPCFSPTYLNIFDSLIKDGASFLDCQKDSFEIQLLLPIRLGNEFGDGFTLAKQVIVTNFENGRLTEFVIICHPVKKYKGDVFLMEVSTFNRYDAQLTFLLKKRLKQFIQFSKYQKRTIDLIMKGMSSRDIATYLDTSVAGVYKMNRKILEKISDNYNMKFTSVKEAVSFYEESFG